MAIITSGKSDGLIVQKLEWAVGSGSTNGANVIIPAPGVGRRLVIRNLVVQNETSTTTLVLVKDNNNERLRASLKDHASLTFNALEGDEWRLTENSPLVIELDGPNQHGYTIRYFVEAV